MSPARSQFHQLTTADAAGLPVGTATTSGGASRYRNVLALISVIWVGSPGDHVLNAIVKGQCAGQSDQAQGSASRRRRCDARVDAKLCRAKSAYSGCVFGPRRRNFMFEGLNTLVACL
jgi:hypothetical protein